MQFYCEDTNVFECYVLANTNYKTSLVELVSNISTFHMSQIFKSSVHHHSYSSISYCTTMSDRQHTDCDICHNGIVDPGMIVLVVVTCDWDVHPIHDRPEGDLFNFISFG